MVSVWQFQLTCAEDSGMDCERRIREGRYLGPSCAGTQ